MPECGTSFFDLRVIKKSVLRDRLDFKKKKGGKNFTFFAFDSLKRRSAALLVACHIFRLPCSLLLRTLSLALDSQIYKISALPSSRNNDHCGRIGCSRHRRRRRPEWPASFCSSSRRPSYRRLRRRRGRRFAATKALPGKFGAAKKVKIKLHLERALMPIVRRRRSLFFLSFNLLLSSSKQKKTSTGHRPPSPGAHHEGTRGPAEALEQARDELERVSVPPEAWRRRCC